MGLNRDRLEPPEKLNSLHQTNSFDSGNSLLDDWLKRRALKNELEGASRTYVLCRDKTVIAYYCLASGSVAQIAATSRVRRNMPDPIPVMIIGRLAVDRYWQGQGIGKALLRDAILRTVRAAEIVGIRAILVHAISQEAKQFYEQSGFTASSLDPMTLMVKIKDAMASMK